MTENEQYFEYLKGRSRLGLWYRYYWLYPKLCRHTKGRTLDLGCGIGDFLSYRVGSVGVDVNPSTVEWCRQQGLNAHVMNPDSLPFEEASFDSVVLDNVLEHLSEPHPLLKEIFRVLRPSGILVIGVPGKKGFACDPDHKVFYDEVFLVSTLGDAQFSLRQIFHMPFRSELLNERMRQYCVYGVFQRG
jgi:SAM-dependent methyltransferase